MKQIIKFAFFITILFLLNCRIGQRSITISLDSLSLQKCELENPDLFDYELVYYHYGNRKINISRRKSKIMIELYGDVQVPFLFFPKIKNINLKPAGGIFPFDYDEAHGELRLYWEKGPLTEMIFNLSERDFNLFQFNILKLEKYLNQKFSDNPWAWDRQFFIKSLIKGDINYFHIKRKESREIILELPAGQYYTDHCFSDIIFKNQERNKITLYLGYNRLFNHDLSLEYSIFVNDQDHSSLEKKIKCE